MRAMMLLVLLFSAVIATAAGSPAAAREQATLYKNPQCGCCTEYTKYLERHGYDVKVVATHDLATIKREHGVPEPLEGCHTTLVGGYVVEGHVPVATLNRLLKEKPAIKGISLPGMPDGSPGMTGRKMAPFTMFAIGDGQESNIYAVE